MDSFNIKTSHYVIGAVALTTALSWNAAIRNTIDKCFPVMQEGLFAGFLYAIIITILLLLLIEYLPSTNSELPASAQEKIKNAELQEKTLNRLTRLEIILAKLLKN
jgi:hypothetical protein